MASQKNEMEFAECINLLSQVQAKYPELRICQILSIAAHKAGRKDNDLFYCPDSTICEGLGLILEK